MSKVRRSIAFGVLPVLAGISYFVHRSDESPVEFPTDPQTVLLLASQDPGKLSRTYHRGILTREIFRQALLMAGREELGLPTRDMALREPFPKKLEDTCIPISIEPLLVPGSHIDITISRRIGPHKQVIWEKTVDLSNSERVDYVKLVELAEGFSRKEFVEALQSVNFVKKGESRSGNTQVPKSVTQRIQQPTFTEQYAAARELHGLIKNEGESPAVVGSLIRAYANLGKLTESHWNAFSKVFKARSLLYAQRLSIRSPDSDIAGTHTAYAHAMCGLYGVALDDLKIIREEAAAQDEQTNTVKSKKTGLPIWVEELEWFCRYRTDKLMEAWENDESNDLFPLLLANLSLEHCKRSRFILEHAIPLLDSFPECYHLINQLCETGKLGTGHRMTLYGPEVLARGLADRLRGIPGLPKKVDDTLPSSRTGNSSAALPSPSDWFSGSGRSSDRDTPQQLKRIAKAARLLVEEVENNHDDHELTWAVLGRMIQEVQFLQAHQRGHFVRYQWNVGTEGFLADFLPTVKDHPYAGFIESYGVSYRTNPAAFCDHLSDIQLVDANLEMYRLFSALWVKDADGQPVGGTQWKLGYRHLDNIDHDLQRILMRRDPPEKAQRSRDLLGTSPFAPEAMGMLIRHDWDYAKDHVAQWQEQLPNNPVVLSELAYHYYNTSDMAEAKTYLEHCIDLAPDQWTFKTLADIYYSEDRVDDWKKTLDKYLETQFDDGLQHGRVQVEIAKKFMERQSYEEAQPYADLAAQTGAGWAMDCASECYEGLEKWDTAELWQRRETERYESAWYEWYFWCERTGKGDIDSARRFANQAAGNIPQETSRHTNGLLGIFHTLNHEPDKAMERFQRALDQEHSPYDGLHLALLADEAGKVKIRNEALQHVAERGNEYVTDGSPRTPEIRLAALFQETLAKPKNAELDLGEAERILDSTRGRLRWNCSYFIGRFLDIHGAPEKARDYMERTATHANRDHWGIFLSRQYLREEGFDEAWHSVLKAQRLMAQRKWELAQLPAEKAAQSGFASGMVAARECYEGLEQWETAEKWVRRLSEEYDHARLDWYLWCKRTGEGDWGAARQFAIQHLETIRARGSHSDLELFGMFHILDSNLKSAAEAFKTAFESTSSPYDGLHLAILEAELGEKDEAQSTLQLIIQNGSQYQPYDKPLDREIELAEVLHKLLGADPDADSEVRSVEAFSRKVEFTKAKNVPYFFGRFLEAVGHKEMGRKYLLRAGADTELYLWNTIAARSRLRDLKVSAPNVKPWSFPG